MTREKARKHVTIYTDGACSGNPGKGGWGVVLIYGDHKKELSGSEVNTTNNRMEMTAVIEGLKALKAPCNVDIYTDSKYILQGITEWMDGWIAKNWRTANKKPVKNVDLWKEILALSKEHNIDWHWVKGHSGNPLNERADKLATSACCS